MLNAITLNVDMQSAVMLSVLAPFSRQNRTQKTRVSTDHWPFDQQDVQNRDRKLKKAKKLHFLLICIIFLEQP